VSSWQQNDRLLAAVPESWSSEIPILLKNLTISVNKRGESPKLVDEQSASRHDFDDFCSFFIRIMVPDEQSLRSALP
jgi:hypothetical protein